MTKIRIDTTQNVSFDFVLASIGDRILAALLDSVFQAAYLIVAIVMVTRVIPWGILIHSEFYLFILIISPVFFYDLLFEIFMNGQTPGKKILSVKIIRLDGNVPGVGDYLMRWCFRTIDSQLLFTYLVAIITIGMNKKGQRLGDIVAGTTAIKLGKQAHLKDTLLFKVQDQQYVPTFVNVMKLSDKDLNIIKEALRIYETTGDKKYAEKLSVKIIEILGFGAGMPPIKLLVTVLKDYNHLSQEQPS